MSKVTVFSPSDQFVTSTHEYKLEPETIVPDVAFVI